jgi:hypothetical protein
MLQAINVFNDAVLGTIKVFVNILSVRMGRISRILSAITSGLLVVLRLKLASMKRVNYRGLFAMYAKSYRMNNRELTDGDYFEERSGKFGLKENNHQSINLI